MRRIENKRIGRHIHRPESVEISLTPLIDTVLVLLIIFMVTMPIIQNTIQVELPTSSTNDDTLSTQGPVTVYLDKAQNLFIDEESANAVDFLKTLEKKLAARGEAEQVVLVKADRSVSYGEVVRLVDDIKYLGGVRYVALATEKQRSS